MIDQGIVALLAADGGVKAILATGGAGSIFQGVVPPDEPQYPCIGYRFVGGSSTPSFDTSGMQRSRLELKCWGATPDAAKQLADAVRRALNGYQGTLSDGTLLSNAWPVHPGMDLFGGDSRFFCRMIEFYLLYTFTN